eukprot:CAMPEP_0176225104 /NCGR_PEP_ID=MMETSP0121_2-20121125/21592_1 /TAXON_ID=160619 /ORGANISM="Kryptoperidinium foliaceum, Strain CCMP 1326" /LENGTH=121 /DNA_ID=CAMNT_0017564367 /DNA_START=252 /DNA_END=613 /DNA_ORIENTATION=+
MHAQHMRNARNSLGERVEQNIPLPLGGPTRPEALHHQLLLATLEMQHCRVPVHRDLDAVAVDALLCLRPSLRFSSSNPRARGRLPADLARHGAAADGEGLARCGRLPPPVPRARCRTGRRA